MPTTTLDQEQTKEMLREVLVELIEERKGEFYELLVEAMEDVALAKAIREGRRNDFVSEEEIQILFIAQ